MILMLVRERLFEHVFLNCQIFYDRTAVFCTVSMCKKTVAINSGSPRDGARFVELEI